MKKIRNIVILFVVGMWIFYPPQKAISQKMGITICEPAVKPVIKANAKPVTDSLKQVAAQLSKQQDNKQRIILQQAKYINQLQNKVIHKKVVVLVNNSKKVQTTKQSAATLLFADAYDDQIDTINLSTVSHPGITNNAPPNKRNFFQRLFNIKPHKKRK